MSLSARARIAAYIVLTAALSSIFYARIIAEGRLRALPVLALMWCPGVAALAIRLVTERSVRGIGWRPGAPRWLAASYLIPALCALAVYGATWITGAGGFVSDGIARGLGLTRHVPLAAIVPLFATLGFVQSALFALGEEIGWRGFLVPELATVSSFTTTSLIAGIVWALYHYPLILFADYHSDAPKWFAVAVFTWMVVAGTFAYAWLRLKSGSVWTGVVVHASHNLFVQQIFDPLTANRAWTPYITTEFGVGLALAYTVVAVYFWTRRAEVEGISTAPAAVATADIAYR